MVFSSTFFLFAFLPLFLIVYRFTPWKAKNAVLLAASLLFYAWGAPKFIFLLLGFLCANFFIVRQLYGQNKHRKLFLALSIAINLGLLVYFKYANFFVDNLNLLLQACGIKPLGWVKIALPIGISFITFQSLSYTVDVYRRVRAPLRLITDYLLYIMMFPQLVAGPIIRFNTIADDIADRRHNDTADNRLYGVYRFIIGLSKKVLIANVLGAQVDYLYALPHGDVTCMAAWAAALAYSFQIYFDFSGYSDMAIGLGYLMGFKFPENFNNPYTSKSVSEFWRRWHITLGAWLKDYLYIPLGGNRVSPFRTYLNLSIVFLVCGIWHGAGWNFIVWGVWHGFFIVCDKLFLNRMLSRVPAVFRILLTFAVVTVGWVFFRLDSLVDALFFIRKLFSFRGGMLQLPPEFFMALVVALLFSFLTATRAGQTLEKVCYAEQRPVWQHCVTFACALLLLTACTASLSASGFNPFIYFKF